MNATDGLQNQTAVKKKAPGSQEEVQDLVPRGMEGKEKNFFLHPLIGMLAIKLKCEPKERKHRRGWLNQS